MRAKKIVPANDGSRPKVSEKRIFNQKTTLIWWLDFDEPNCAVALTDPLCFCLGPSLEFTKNGQKSFSCSCEGKLRNNLRTHGTSVAVRAAWKYPIGTQITGLNFRESQETRSSRGLNDLCQLDNPLFGTQHLIQSRFACLISPFLRPIRHEFAQANLSN